MLDADISEGDLSQITLAIQNALKPATTVLPQRLPSLPQVAPSINSIHQEQETVDGLTDIPDTDEFKEQERAESEHAPRSSRPRKPTVPKIVELDVKSGVSLESYVEGITPEREPERNLLILAWFKEHRKEESVTADHIYTCYRLLKWPSGIEDFSWPLRYLKKKQLVSSPSRGHYEINHVGLSQVESMKASR